jgi:hypothetical protein
MPKQKASFPWDYFDELSDKRVKCRLCSNEFNKKTSNQQSHLERHHQITRTSNSSNISSSCSSSLTNFNKTTKNNLNNNHLNGTLLPPISSSINFLNHQNYDEIESTDEMSHENDHQFSNYDDDEHDQVI